MHIEEGRQRSLFVPFMLQAPLSAYFSHLTILFSTTFSQLLRLLEKSLGLIYPDRVARANSRRGAAG